MAAPDSSNATPPDGSLHQSVYSGATPRWQFPMPQGVWAYSTGDDLDQCPRGVYRASGGDSWTYMAPLPYVLQRLIRRANGSRRDATVYRLALTADPHPDDVALCAEDDVRTGMWANKLDVALSPAPQIIQGAAAAILDTARKHAEVCELAPRVRDDVLELPASDVGPAGYGDRAAGEGEARDAWTEIATIATRTPRLALTLGVALGGLYIAPLHRQPFFWYLTGEGGQGKTTALLASAGVYGAPMQVVKSMNATQNALTQELGTLSMLPAFRDEQSSGKWPPQEIERLILSVAQGGNKSTGGRDLNAKTSARWDSVFLLTGNHSMLGHITNEGAARRLIEVETPITNNADDSERIEKILLGKPEEGIPPYAYGWPLHWLRETGLDVRGFAQLITTAEEDLPLPSGAMPGGGVARGLGRHLALAVAGAARLEHITGVTGMRDAAITEARELLDRQMAEIRERGLKPSERLVAAVREAMASRPAAFPTRQSYKEQKDSSFGLNRDVDGWDLTGDKHRGDVAVMTGKLEVICQAAGIDSRTGLRQLASENPPRLLRGNEKDGRLRTKLRAADRRHEVYVLIIHDEDNNPAEPGTEDTGPRNPATPQDRTDSAVDQQESRPESSAEQSPAPDSEPAPDDSVVALGSAGPVRHIPGQDGYACRLCGTGRPPFADDVGPVHPMCATGQAQKPAEKPVEPSNDSASAKTSVRRGSARQGRKQRQQRGSSLEVCGVLAADGLWLPNQDTPVSVAFPADIAAAYRLAFENNLRQLWIHPSAHAHLGIPDTREIGGEVGPATAIEHPWATVEGYRVDAGDGPGLAAWVNVQPIGSEPTRRIGMSFPAYDWSRTEWHTASSGKALRDAVLRYAVTTQEPWYMSANETTASILRKSITDQLASTAEKKGESTDGLLHLWSSTADVPQPAGLKDLHITDWSRVLLDDEEDHMWTHSYDINGAEASVNSMVFVGVGEPERISLTEWDARKWKKTAGYMLANVPRQHPGLDPRLPDLLWPWRRNDERNPDSAGGPTWVPVETLLLLDEQGVPVEVSEALVWRDSRRLLRFYGEQISKARLDLVNADDEASGLALEALKAAYKTRIGDFNRVGSRIYRPDIRDMIKAKARANGYRKVRDIAAATGRYPISWHVDAARYTSDDPDPCTAAPAPMNISRDSDGYAVFNPGLGQWKPEEDKTLPLVKVREYLGERAFTAKVDKLLRKDR